MEQDMNVGGLQIVLLIIYAVIIVLPFWKITTKAGYSGWLSLLMIIPLVNLIYIYFLAFANWPSLRRG